MDLLVFLCTIFHDSIHGDENNLDSLYSLLKKTSNSKVILLHGGTVRLMEFMQMAKVFPNVLLDLSYTIMKYENSSIDFDLRYLFANCDRRICIGSDYPEWTLNELRRRFVYFSKHITKEQAENIAFRNIVHFCNIQSLHHQI
jgi:predicted TIM-barrel fold metal-dependent hydrolase